MNEHQDNATSVLVADKIHKTYRMGQVDVPVLKGASLSVQEGEWIAVLGTSGSGKSTLLHLMGDLDSPDVGRGEVRYRGRPTSNFSNRERNDYRNQSIGFVFQFYHLLPELTVLENTLIPAMVAKNERKASKRATELLERFGLEHRLGHRPRELSGGERQRVAIARALVNEPEILLADEPTGNLDEDTGAGILELLAGEHERGLGVVMVTHDRSISQLADRVVELHHGQITAASEISR